MLNAIWAGMLLLGILYGACTGNLEVVSNATLDSAGEAISLCITMAGVMALWMGLMEIAGQAGLTTRLTRGITPFLHFMFPNLPKEHPAGAYIATNIIANILGLGWACTPAGLKAMEALADLERERGRSGFGTKGTFAPEAGGMDRGSSERKVERAASDEMCTFLILNISSLQLIPVNMIAYRSQYGSKEPTAVIAPAILATLISTLTAVVYCKYKSRSKGR